ncbi:hypothetical protein H4R33_005652 [Dimargaris cristalligena]|nr:hypothetical protein H4R33_005652 [Dimargaris cristalligena]
MVSFSLNNTSAWGMLTIALHMLAISAKCLPEPTTPSTSVGFTAADSKFGSQIEGAATDAQGNLYAVNFGTEADKDTLGIAAGTGAQSLFYKDADATTWFNSMRFVKTSSGIVTYAGDVVGHRVLKLTGAAGSLTSSVFCQDPTMLQPNDMAAASTGDLFLSGMNYTATTTKGNGDLWWCNAQGQAKRLDTLERTNGIEVSPNNQYLYLSEAQNKDGAVIGNRIWRYEVDPSTGVKMGADGTPTKSLFVDFATLDQTQATDIDGMRCDTQGNLFVTRNGLGQVVVFSPERKELSRITAPFKSVKNLEFGGSDGKTLYIVGTCDAVEGTTDAQKGCVSAHPGQQNPGLSWSLLQ